MSWFVRCIFIIRFCFGICFMVCVRLQKCIYYWLMDTCMCVWVSDSCSTWHHKKAQNNAKKSPNTKFIETSIQPNAPKMWFTHTMRATFKSLLRLLTRCKPSQNVLPYKIWPPHFYGNTGWVKNVPSDEMWHYRTKSWDKWNPFAIDPDVHADLWYKNGIDRSRNSWAMSPALWAPENGLV